MNFKVVMYFLGWVMMLEGIAMTIPMIICLVTGDDAWKWFLLSIGIAFVFGFPMSRKRNKEGKFFTREGYMATSLGWFVLSLIGALPFTLSGRIPHYIDAVFEIVSGFTTTGSSILSDVEALGYGLLFFRSFSHWFGGMGVLVLILAFLPMNSGSYMNVMRAESPGPNVGKLVPRVSETAKTLYLIYLIMTVTMIITYILSGMEFFDAVCIGLGTAGTGGFAIRNSGMADYSMFSQTLITIWMILFGVTFNVYYFISKKKWKDAFKCEEFRIYICIIVFSAVLIAAVLLKQTYPTEGAYFSIHHSFFTVASMITTTGFSTLDFNTWPEITKTVLVLLMFCGACAGSTGGGIKVSRIVILAKESYNEFRFLLHPKAVVRTRFEGKPVENTVLRSLHNYIGIYIIIFMLSVLIVSFDNFSFETNFTAVAATLNNIGPGLGAVGPLCNFSEYSYLSKIVFIIDMLAGRLELLPVLMLLNPKSWTRHY